MAFQECKLATLLLNEFFGPVIASIAEELKWGPKPLKLLSSSIKLPLSTVRNPRFFSLYLKVFKNMQIRLITGEASSYHIDSFQFRGVQII